MKTAGELGGKTKFSDFLQDIGRPVAYNPGIASLLEGVKEALFLSQIIYWTGRGVSADGWVYKTSAEIEAETGMTYREQTGARNRLKQLCVLEDRYDRLKHVLYFRVNLERLNELWEIKQQIVCFEKAGENSISSYYKKKWEHLTKCQMGKRQNVSSRNDKMSVRLMNIDYAETTSKNYNGSKSERLATSALSLEDFLLKEKDYNQEAVEAIQHFLTAYEKYIREAHPNLRPEQWHRHLDTILECTDEQDRLHNFTSSCLEEMIDRYFSIDTFWPDCNYSLNHFNTDGIKSRRMFELGSERL